MSTNVKRRVDYGRRDRCEPGSFSKKLMVYLTEFKLEYLKKGNSKLNRSKGETKKVVKREIIYATDKDVAKFKLESIYNGIGEIEDLRFLKVRRL